MKVNQLIYVQSTTVEHHDSCLGIAEDSPRLSWNLSAPTGWHQHSYEIELRSLDGNIEVFGPFPTHDNSLVPWPAAPLTPRELKVARVRVRGEDGQPSAWSDPLMVERGPASEDWVARPIQAPWAENPDSDRRPSLMRTEFQARPGIVSALLRITAHGLFEAELNGTRVGNEALAPGWSVYDQRLRYSTYDVTNSVRAGDNAIGAWLGDGWYRGRIGFSGGNRNLYGSDLSLIAQLEIRYADGTEQIVATDDGWKSQLSPIIFSGIYDGEIYDAREEQHGFSLPGFNDSAWSQVAYSHRDPRTLVSPDGPPVRCTRKLDPRSSKRLTPESLLVDFGQNLAGRLRVRATGSEGQQLTMQHAEIITDDQLVTRPLRLAKATDTYIFGRTTAEITWEPRFTYHGFRYALIQAPAEVLDSLSVQSLAYHSDMHRIGSFACSNEQLNQLHSNVLWSLRSNFVDIPTDCPQRDERLGWTGDIQMFAPTASFLYDVTGMLASWLRDLRAEQLPDGTVPWYVPVVPGREMWTPVRPGAAWGDAAVLVPWELYQATGDLTILEDNWSSAQGWVDLIASRLDSNNLWTGDFQLGDWLDPSAPPEDPTAAMTDPDFVASAYGFHSAQTLSRIAHTLQLKEQAERYSALAAAIRTAILERYVTESGELHDESQTGYALLIEFEIVTEHQRKHAGDRLSALVIANNYRIGTGFVGTPLISHALSSTGNAETAYSQLLTQECPSWLYPLSQEATTMWERWDSQLPDGSVNPGQMTSFNHYAFGAVAAWMHNTIAGIRRTAPAYQSVEFAPLPGGGLTWAQASVETARGLIAIRWEHIGSTVNCTLQVPSGVSAILRTPQGEVHELQADESTVSFELPSPDAPDARVTATAREAVPSATVNAG